MAASLFMNRHVVDALAEYLEQEPLTEEVAGEERMVLGGMSWQRYLAIDKALGDDRPGPRFYYLDGELEIATTSSEHERVKKWLAGFIADHFDETGLEVTPRGQATMRIEPDEVGAEPDESWCIGEEKEFPDIVLEIALTSGGVKKLELYRRFNVPEAWIWRRNKLEVYVLRADGSGYDPSNGSQLLPDLDISLLERCALIPSWQEARRAFRSGLAAGK